MRLKEVHCQRRSSNYSAKSDEPERSVAVVGGSPSEPTVTVASSQLLEPCQPLSVSLLERAKITVDVPLLLEARFTLTSCRPIACCFKKLNQAAVTTAVLAELSSLLSP